MSVGVVLFPGTNCERDVVEAVQGLGGEAEIVWHGDRRIPWRVDAIVLPGGFAHGDYLRTGAIARFSPVMAAIGSFAAAGGPVLGVCNGFQILCEAGLLPGALQKNRGLKFLCATVAVRVESTATVASIGLTPGEVLQLPINHFEGSYACPPETLEDLRAEGRIVFRYEENPNGSIDSIAGICSVGGNVVGLMPHPERACHPLLGGTDGTGILASLLQAAGRHAERAIPAFFNVPADTPTARHAP
jgi:phosphoribosylformylglycinamidine synthase I